MTQFTKPPLKPSERISQLRNEGHAFTLIEGIVAYLDEQAVAAHPTRVRTTEHAPNPTQLQRALEMAYGTDDDATQLANELTSHNQSRVAVAVANLLLWVAEREEGAHPVAGTDDVPFCNVHPDTICPTHGGCPTPRPAHPAPISSPGDDNPQACDRGACTPHLTEMCGKHQDAYEANCVGRNLEQGLTTDGFAADAKRERNPVIAVIDDYIAGLRIERDEALVKLAASEARCEQLTGELAEAMRMGKQLGESSGAIILSLSAKLTESEAAVARLREELGKRDTAGTWALDLLEERLLHNLPYLDHAMARKALRETREQLSALDQPSQLEISHEHTSKQ